MCLLNRYVCLALVSVCFLAPAAAYAQRMDTPQADKVLDITVFTHADWQQRPQESRLIANLSEGNLRAVKDASNFVHYTTAEPVYLSGRYWNVKESDFPVIIIANAGGGYFYKASKSTLPDTEQELYRQARLARQKDIAAHQSQSPAIDLASVEQSCPDGICPPDPQRQPWLPNAPWNQPDSDMDGSSVSGLWGGDTPIRDGLGYAAWLAGAVVFLFFLSVVFIGLIILAFAAAYVFKR